MYVIFTLSLIVCMVVCSLHGRSGDIVFHSIREYPYLRVIEDSADIMNEEIPEFDINKEYARRPARWLHDSDFRGVVKNMESTWYKGWLPGDNWYNFPLVVKGQIVGDAAKMCPRTIRLLKKVRCCQVAGFALVLPMSMLPVHRDPVGSPYGSMAANMLLTENDHNYLIVQDAARQYTHEHRRNKLVVFDSSKFHTAVNGSNTVRVIFYMDFKVQD
ncbi:hypothetical protein EB118_11885 [bacterium]|nr:hypothetical protein [bacterium]NDD83628.1 hypothetical protein [bacterium]NDG30760.1 hypothetical protein [bacterium]